MENGQGDMFGNTGNGGSSGDGGNLIGRRRLLTHLVARAAKRLPRYAMIWREVVSEDEGLFETPMLFDFDESDVPTEIDEDELADVHLTMLKAYGHLLRDARTRPETKWQIIDWVMHKDNPVAEVKPFTFQAACLLEGADPETVREMFMAQVRRDPDIRWDELKKNPFILRTQEIADVVSVLEKKGYTTELPTTDEVRQVIEEVVLR